MLLDLRLAFRSLRRSPTFAVTAVLTLALGIGGSTAIFTIVHAVLLRPLPYPGADRLVRIWEANPAKGQDLSAVSDTAFLSWRARARSFDGLALFSSSAGNVLGTPNGAVQAVVTFTTPNLFSLLGVQPLLGAVRAADPAPEAERRAFLARDLVLSFDLWRDAFGSDPGVIGKTVRIENRDVCVITAVMPERFSFPDHTDAWVPGEISPPAAALRGYRSAMAVGRLKPGRSLSAARTDMASVSVQLAGEYPATHRGWTSVVQSLQESSVGSYRLALVTLYAAVLCVLLIACANVSNLLLARGAARRRELSVRIALGASRGRIARQLLTESLALTVIGGAAGWLLAETALPVFLRLLVTRVPRLLDTRLDLAALAYCAAVTVAATLATGLLPAMAAARIDVQPALSTDGERSTTRFGHARLQRLLVAGEIAASMVLVLGAVLLIQTVVRLRNVDLGFNPDRVISIDVRLPMFRFSPRWNAGDWLLLANETRALLDRLRAVPGVASAAVTTNGVPLDSSAFATAHIVRLPNSGKPDADGETHAAFVHAVSPDYFKTLGMSLVQGRDFRDDDAAGEAQLTMDRSRTVPRDGVAVVNETAARTGWPDKSPVGDYVTTDVDRRTTPRRQIVGVVRDVRSDALRKAPPPEIYVPYLEEPGFQMNLLVRTPLPPGTLVPTIRREMRALDAELSSANVRTLNQVVDQSMGSSTASAALVGLFAAIALVLSAVGVYGVVAFGVARRTREIGIRRALGATPRDVARLFLRQAGLAIASGIAAGLVGSLTLGRVVVSLLFGVTPTDTFSIAAAALLLSGVAMAASYLPVRKALRLDPADALRSLAGL